MHIGGTPVAGCNDSIFCFYGVVTDTLQMGIIATDTAANCDLLLDTVIWLMPWECPEPILYSDTCVQLYGTAADDFYRAMKYDSTANVFHAVGATDGKGLFSKLDANGNVLWSKTYDDDVTLFDFITAPNGDFVLYGEYGFDPNIRLYAARVDAGGNVIWAKTYHHSGRTRRPDKVINSTGDTYILSSAWSCCAGSQLDDMVLIRIDGNGNIIWQKHYNSGLDEQHTDIIPADNGGCIAVKLTTDYGIITKVDSNGNVVDAKRYTSQHNLWGLSLIHI